MEWFESWFDTEYYHTLYQYRDDKEAEDFIDNLYKLFNIKNSDTILDLACGKGRHAFYMSYKGNTVDGIDLSKNSIDFAKLNTKKLNSSNVHFQVDDMRTFRMNKTYDYIFNLFTSFGYFNSKEENIQVIKRVNAHQKSNGIIAIDYLNSHFVRTKGEERYEKTIDSIHFLIKKYFQDDFVYKDILVTDNKKQYKFQEKVQLFSINEIESMLTSNGYNISHHFGDYQLNPYHKMSERSIITGVRI